LKYFEKSSGFLIKSLNPKNLKLKFISSWAQGDDIPEVFARTLKGVKKITDPKKSEKIFDQIIRKTGPKHDGIFKTLEGKKLGFSRKEGPVYFINKDRIIFQSSHPTKKDSVGRNFLSHRLYEITSQPSFWERLNKPAAAGILTASGISGAALYNKTKKNKIPDISN
jgi:hypothetical protein